MVSNGAPTYSYGIIVGEYNSFTQFKHYNADGGSKVLFEENGMTQDFPVSTGKPTCIVISRDQYNNKLSDHVWSQDGIKNGSRNQDATDTSQFSFPSIGNHYSLPRAGNATILLYVLLPFLIPQHLANSLSANPWQIFEPEIVPLWVPAGGAPQLLVPISDVSAGAWTPSTGTSLYATLDEATYSDADYIVTSSASTCEMRVTTASDPSVSTGHILRYRLLAGTGSITAILKQGATTIASYGPHTLTGAAQDFSQTLTGGQADSITDYTDLRVVFTSS